MTRYTVGIDIGTTGTKTVLLDTLGGIVATATRATDLHSTGPGIAEADTGQWYTNAIESIREVLSVSGVAAEQGGALATSGMVPAVVPVDANAKLSGLERTEWTPRNLDQKRLLAEQQAFTALLDKSAALWKQVTESPL